MLLSRETFKATAATDAIAGQAAVAAHQAILARQAQQLQAQRNEFAYIAGLPPTRRTVAQNNRLAIFLAQAPRTHQAGPTAIHALSCAVHVIEVQRGGTVYRINDQSDGFYMVIDGGVILYDVKDKDESEEDDGVVDRLGLTDSFGEEDLLSNSRRAHRAEVTTDGPALLLRVPPELYRKHLQHLHQPDFEDKVEFLGRLEVFRSLPQDTLRKLAPCFSQVVGGVVEELRAKEYLVRQGERADSMYAIASGQCSVLVDPNFRPDMSTLAESDPKKAMQASSAGGRWRGGGVAVAVAAGGGVCLIGPGNIVGDMTVLANVRKRTASIFTLTDLVTYKIRRATFLRRVPPTQLEALRQVAEAKIKITERRVQGAATGPGGTGVGKGGGPMLVTLRDKILHGHQLRQLSQPHTGVGPLDLRGIIPGAHSRDVEALLTASLAAAASAAAAAAAAASPAAPLTALTAPGSHVIPDGTAIAAAALAAAAGGGGGAMAASLVEMRGRFAMGPRKSASLNAAASSSAAAIAAATAALSSGSQSDRAAAVRARIRAGATSSGNGALVGGLRGAEINYTWGLGPGTMINSLLERPATASSGSATVRRSQPIGSRRDASDIAGGGAPATQGSAATHVPDPALDSAQHEGSGHGRTVAFAAVTSTAPPPPVSPSPPPLAQSAPSAAAPLQPTRHPHPHSLQLSALTSSRVASAPGAVRAISSSTLPYPRGSSPQAPYVSDGYGPPVNLPYHPVSAWTAVDGGGGGGGSGGGARGGRSQLSNSGPIHTSERLASALASGARRSLNGAVGSPPIAAPLLLRPGPLIMGPPAPAHLGQQRPAGGDDASVASSPVASPFAVAAAAAAAEVAEAALGRSPPRRIAAGVDSSPLLDQTRSRTTFMLPEDASDADVDSSAAASPSITDGGGAAARSVGSGRRRRLPKRQRSMGKARFARSLVTQNSSVDALVAEAMIRRAQSEQSLDMRSGAMTAATSAATSVAGDYADSGTLAAELSGTTTLAAEHSGTTVAASEAPDPVAMTVAAAAERLAAEVEAAEGRAGSAVQPTEAATDGNGDDADGGAPAQEAVAEGGVDVNLPAPSAGAEAAEGSGGESASTEGMAARTGDAVDSSGGSVGEDRTTAAEAPDASGPAESAAESADEPPPAESAAVASMADAAAAAEGEGGPGAAAAVGGGRIRPLSAGTLASESSVASHDHGSPRSIRTVRAHQASPLAAAAGAAADAVVATSSPRGARVTSASAAAASRQDAAPGPSPFFSHDPAQLQQPHAVGALRKKSEAGNIPFPSPLAPQPASPASRTRPSTATASTAVAQSTDGGAPAAAQQPPSAVPAGRWSVGGTGPAGAGTGPARPTGRPAQAVTLQLVVPDQQGAPSHSGHGRSGPAGPPSRRAVGSALSPKGARQYPFVGPFLTVTKGVLIPAGAAAQAGGAQLRQLVSSPQLPLPVVPRLGATGMGGGKGEAMGAGPDRSASPEPRVMLASDGGLAFNVPLSGLGLGASASLAGAGKLRKGAALYKPLSR
ncbi:hypothetical protein GPECTOR_17g831 [Gonium pectorale]|uniref:Cyclic nucleotide-binding domain-containing protein n=1 Tax=Gonium pectorale TaxID=33097 RepID=A0A150GK86_GONPE|nr:hypothetical protein GPECTOR_17g831 [Gonium pectorale]|eukprot:KXZ50194.1 hypothetical protein GPECTOR_17g831 [Gonium pectorale]